MARPVGQFARKRDECLTIIQELAGVGVCQATNAYLARRLDVTPRQICKYIADLRKMGKLEVRTSSLQTNTATGNIFKKRIMRPTAVPMGIKITLPTKTAVGVNLEELAALAETVQQEENARNLNYIRAYSEETNGNISP